MKSAPDGSRAILCRIAAPLILSLTAAVAQAQSCAPEAGEQYVLATRSDEVRQFFLFQPDGLDRLVVPSGEIRAASDDPMLSGLEDSVWIRTESRADPATTGLVARADNWNFETFSENLGKRASAPADCPAADEMTVAEFAWNDRRSRETTNAIPEPSAALLMLPAAMLLIRRRRK